MNATILVGYENFDPELSYAGIIFNQVAGSRHEQKLIAATEQYTDFKILGAVSKTDHIQIPERHLGLMPANEAEDRNRVITAIASQIANEVNINRLLELTSTEKSLVTQMAEQHKVTPDIRLGVARDAAFGFYYPVILE